MKLDKFMGILMGAVSFSFAAAIISLVAFLIFKGLDNISWEFLTKFPSNSMESGGIFPAILGSAYFLLIALTFSIPIGVLGAVFLSEYSTESWLKKIILGSTNALSSIPSIVFGLFGLALFSITFGFRTSLLSGGLTLGVLALPYIISNTHEALKAVPNSYREASLALGATKGETVFRVVIPASVSRILTGVIISIGRVIGETAPILFTGAAFYTTSYPDSLLDPAMSLPTHIFVLSTVYPESVTPNLEGTISVMMIIVVAIFALVSLKRLSERRKSGL